MGVGEMRRDDLCTNKLLHRRRGQFLNYSTSSVPEVFEGVLLGTVGLS